MTEHHILNEDQTETLCGMKWKDLPQHIPIITLTGYRLGTKLTVCVKCAETYLDPKYDACGFDTREVIDRKLAEMIMQKPEDAS